VNTIEKMNRFSIKDIENLTGVRAHTIRIWEQRYGILQPKRTPTNIRYYDAEDLKIALRIALLNDFGYKISRINKMSEAEMNALIQKINDKDFQLQVLTNQLLEATLNMDIDLFEQLLNKYIRKNGIERTTEELIFLFLEKIGVMWITDRLFPAQEHLVSNVIYRKLSLAIDNLPVKSPDAHPTVLLFLPEGEGHDLGLLYVYFLLLKYGKNPLYLGPNSPLTEVQQVVTVKKPAFFYLHLTSVTEEFDGNRYLQRLSSLFPDVTVLISGNMIRRRKFAAVNDKMKFFYSLNEVKETLFSL
jgi:MerR family transcriptional regulator, light-induced transcriptional regulator